MDPALILFGIPLMAVIGRTIVQPYLRYRERREGGSEQVRALEERVALLEQSLETTDRVVARLREERDFDRQLASRTVGYREPARLTG
jgi:hypothetical protein